MTTQTKTRNVKLSIWNDCALHMLKITRTTKNELIERVIWNEPQCIVGYEEYSTKTACAQMNQRSEADFVYWIFYWQTHI